jgi:hypothetical protein
MPTTMGSSGTAAIDLYWLPLGAGGHSVRWNGRVFEWFAARLAHRDRCDLYHSALEVQVPEGRFVIEQAPAWSERSERGVVAEGAVGARAAGRLRLFRYEIRCWRGGVIPDVAEAVESPKRLSDDADHAPTPRARAPGADSPMGPRRTAYGRDVELELAHLMADHAQRPRRWLDSPAAGRPRPRLARRRRDRPTAARGGHSG